MLCPRKDYVLSSRFITTNDHLLVLKASVPYEEFLTIRNILLITVTIIYCYLDRAMTVLEGKNLV